MNFDFKRMLKFELNIADKEKKYRLYAGIALIVISVFMADILFLVLGLILAGTGFSGWCPVYSGLNKNTLTGSEATNSETADSTDNNA